MLNLELQNLFVLAGNHSQISFYARLLLYVFCKVNYNLYIIHTYIHTYPPKGGMYVCMYVLCINYNLP